MDDPGGGGGKRWGTVKQRLLRLLGWDRSAGGIYRLIRLLPRASLPLTLVLGFVVILGALVPNLFAIATGLVVGQVADGIAGGLSSPAGQRLLWTAVAAGGLFVLQELFGPLSLLASFPLGMKAEQRLADDVMRASLNPVGISHLEDPAILDSIQQARGIGAGGTGPTETVPALVALGTLRLASIGSAVIVATFNVWLAIALVVFRLGIRRQVFRQMKRAIDLVVGQTQRMRQANYLRNLALEPASAKEIRVFGMVRWLLDRFDAAWHSAMADSWRERRGSARTVVRGGLLVMVADIIAFGLLARAATRGEISVGQLTTYIQAVFGIARIGIMSQQDDQIAAGVASLDAALKVQKSVPPTTRVSGKPTSSMPVESIRFEDVSFRYPGGHEDVLDGFDLEIPAGRSLAVVGANGAGKTTLVKLLSRLYDPTSGRITVDGVDLLKLDPYEWQARMAAIFQDFVRYQLPVSANVAPGGVTDLDTVRSAAAQAGALEIIEGLEHGWDTVLDRRYQRGAELSGGQWQRVALARALHARAAGAGVLVLDEPTANLDVRAEAELYDRFLELTEGTTTILISHRFSTVRRADNVCVIDAGKVIELGSHAELVSAGGAYARMFELQAARFREVEPEGALNG
ncbi:MAG: ABC transporter ATP-binding protein/permease [Actinobacteria bacterium]|nr:ABC transporter ATP-binding protein/permease [Actinomycetota bacterium]